MQICRCADLRSGEMQRNAADIICECYGKMRMWQCRYAANERMPVAYLHCTFSLNINMRLTCANKLFTYLLTYLLLVCCHG